MIYIACAILVLFVVLTGTDIVSQQYETGKITVCGVWSDRHKKWYYAPWMNAHHNKRVMFEEMDNGYDHDAYSLIRVISVEHEYLGVASELIPGQGLSNSTAIPLGIKHQLLKTAQLRHGRDITPCHNHNTTDGFFIAHREYQFWYQDSDIGSTHVIRIKIPTNQ